MKGSETKFVAFMQGASKRFVIPVYQRNYDWKTENCKRLYDDLIKVIRNERKSHFFGSVVSVYNPYGANEEFLVIDGQQRLTTVSLLLLAMYNLLNKGAIVAQKASLRERIYEEYLVDKYQEDDTRIKLKPVKNDQCAFSKLFEDAKDHVPESNLTINYNYFYDRIQKEEITVDELFDAICRLEIISITLNPDDNPQLIFESLNSTGLALSEGDKIRNFILMGQPTKLQNEYYEKYWNRIEVFTQYDVSAFIRDYLSVKQQATPSISRVYATFKEYVEDGQIEIEDLLKDMLAYAGWYSILLKGGTADKQINACIYRLNRLETTTTRPFFLEVLRLKDSGKLTMEEVGQIFMFTENYLYRRTMCDLPTNMLNKIFLVLHKEIMRYDGTDANYMDKFKFALLSKKERARFPDDDEFIEAFSTRPVYQMNSKNKIYTLEKFENFGTIEDKDIYRHVDDGEYSIEHIMPQHLTPTWINELGEDYENIHETWLHRMANLTFTGYNSKYSNNSFEEKKTMKNGFNESGLRLNTYVAAQDKWGLAQLEARNEILMKRALEIWALPVTEYKPPEKQLDSFTLDDDISFTGRVLARFSYKNQEQPVVSWIDMYERMLKILHAGDKSVLSKLAYSMPTGTDLASYVSNKPENLRGALQIDTDIYAERNTSTELKLSLLRRFFKQFDADPTDLVFYLRDENETEEEELEGTRYEIRKRYWNFAIPYIKEAHGEKGSFSNVNTSKENWISGFFGIGGFSIGCVANFDVSRVELTLGRSKKEDNKAAFDKLFSHKDEIEKQLGVNLNWLRSNDTKGSYITYRLENVSITNEADWLLMAKFHAEWSKKFYDVLVPYLKG